jgi:hypothetical protein
MEKGGADDLFFVAAAEAARETGKIIPVDDKKYDDVPDEPIEQTDGEFIEPTEEEMATLQHVADYINWSTYR